MIPFKNPEKVDDVFCKVLTPNDDSGRHGVLIPVFAYRLFPDFIGYDPLSATNYEASITTHWDESEGWSQKDSKWKHYHRYPERRMTSLSPELLNTKPKNSLLIVGKYKDLYEYECIIIHPTDPWYLPIGTGLFHFDLDQEKVSGLSAIFPYSELVGKIDGPSVLDELVAKVKEISNRGFVPSMRSGDTGVGFTFESLLGIKANSGKEPDYNGIEIKCSRSNKPKNKRTAQTGKQTLFALVPNWGVAGDRKGLVQSYGYWDESRERTALYCTIKIAENNLGWKLEVVESEGKIYVCKHGERIVQYEMSDLEAALESKHKESIFITAHATKLASGEEAFHYDSLVHAKEVLFKEFIALIKENVIGLDFAIHMKEGKARDHGFLWRLENKKHLLRLFKYVVELY
ncbi:hypothetical protein E0485_18905 [Paenibacillus albiflavus]|uniref:MvaI/BcnI restriction endonuclease domain-containing protein n=1 Tax=Paenibacillus albiflavus TaxID=2545760 RepID=A0A4R4E890_9BACL|nr:MvaI/BcnI family restriction endonuclease [Paenibacillus albiflavus]TCZ75060.1 hypothetical protein E0485_18905 [Paenibacillus albiflavus]